MHVGHTEEFIRHSKNTVEISNFYEGELRFVETLTLKNGQQVKMENKYGTSARIDHYEWEGDIMIKILTQWSDDHCLTEFHRVEGGDGMLAMFRIRPDGTRRAMHQPLPKGVTIKSLAETIRTRLVKGLYESVSKLKLKEPIYCIALVYSGEGNPTFPVTVEIGLESRRQQLIKEHGKEAKHLIWSPEDGFTHPVRPIAAIDDAEYEQACEWYADAMMAKSSDAPAIKLINEIAAELAKLDWARIAPITKDFVVFAVDLETGDLQKNMKKSVSAPILKDLKARNLI